MVRPILVTCGEPAGIGPELAPKLLAAHVPFVWIGDPTHLPPGTDWTGISDLSQLPADTLPVLSHDFAQPATPGQPDAGNARGVIEVIERAVSLTQSGAASGICTMPIHKKALKDGAGFAFPGHTEFLAHLAGAAGVAMMLASTTVEPPCRVVPATIHIALSEVPAQLTPEALERAIRITHDAMIRDFGIARPRIAIAGLNPHAGEGGAMGHEELDWIAPLILRLKDEGLNLTGPLPADTMFHATARIRYDAAICAYHDQALIPIKTLDFSGGVNITLGLPFVRTSPDHGTAFDIAGKGIADADSAIAALRMAWDMAQTRGTA
ncbi:4-hydroxythreonine-4-phosphate dehydrogenase PdxA [Paracoccus aerodenitrificans]|uniref:4-hydroxythreonine-4-phosphate dehydrogenase PdxA n=1 Tax=Paracoccus aerodenitrificans TaxID=3017781 RepID=UPI0022F08397|nr:4-hydroxythreonine-4-phosphate dehydrogenase PdxA [Paracoccus aerodenitrificans]WBU64163.1 4-hydroxythreonine-4-phosphate dehydrogenase PdxA [Paracoccus aerodenitrificans]